MNAKQVAQQLADNADMVVRYLLPSGKLSGKEYHVGSVEGEPGNSLSVCVQGSKAGIWADFASEQRGDLLDLWMQVKGVGLVDAINQACEYLGVDTGNHKFFTVKKQWSKPVKPSCKSISTGPVYDYLTKERGLSVDTLKTFKIADGGDCIVFPFLRDDKPVMIKRLKLARNGKKKDIRPTSENQEPCLFGWQAIDEKSRTVILCEGEIDCMSLHQIGHDALSVPFGGGKGQNWIENEYDQINRFDDIYICMDQDSAGLEATIEIIERLGRHRCKILKLQKYKDANEAMLAGYDIFDLQNDLRVSKTCDPDELRQLAEFHTEIMEEFYPTNEKKKGAVLPWPKTADKVRLRLGDISVWAGISSHGKSLLTSQISVDLVSQGYRVCIASMEMSPMATGQKMYQQIGGNDRPSPDYAESIKEFITDSVWIFNVFGTAKADKIISVFQYAFYRYGVRHFVIDSLAKCGIREDDYNEQKAFIDRLMEFAGENNVHVHVIIHIRKLESEDKFPGKMDVKGTGGLTDMVDNVFIIWRNKKKEKIMFEGVGTERVCDKPDAYLSVVKQRKTGEEPTFALWFHPQSCQFIESNFVEPKKYIYTN